MGSNAKWQKLLLPGGQNLILNLLIAAGLLLLLVQMGSVNTPAAPPPVAAEVAEAVQEPEVMPVAQATSQPEELQAQPEPQLPPAPEIPNGLLLITTQREAYMSGDLRLVIPKLQIDQTVQDGVTEADLMKGPGLYDYAQLPGEPGGNVSIAGHRDIHGSIFYYIDQLTIGDRLYLVYQDTIYIYTYEETKIVKPTDWGPIHTQGFSCLTLTSCDPIGTSRNRIIVTARLEHTLPYTADYVFKS